MEFYLSIQIFSLVVARVNPSRDQMHSTKTVEYTDTNLHLERKYVRTLLVPRCEQVFESEARGKL